MSSKVAQVYGIVVLIPVKRVLGWALSPEMKPVTG